MCQFRVRTPCENASVTVDDFNHARHIQSISMQSAACKAQRTVQEEDGGVGDGSAHHGKPIQMRVFVCVHVQVSKCRARKSFEPTEHQPTKRIAKPNPKLYMRRSTALSTSKKTTHAIYSPPLFPVGEALDGDSARQNAPDARVQLVLQARLLCCGGVGVVVDPTIRQTYPPEPHTHTHTHAPATRRRCGHASPPCSRPAPGAGWRGTPGPGAASAWARRRPRAARTRRCAGTSCRRAGRR